jgi:hypothetical protein
MDELVVEELTTENADELLRLLDELHSISE